MTRLDPRTPRDDIERLADAIQERPSPASRSGITIKALVKRAESAERKVAELEERIAAIEAALLESQPPAAP